MIVAEMIEELNKYPEDELVTVKISTLNKNKEIFIDDVCITEKEHEDEKHIVIW